MDPIRMFCKPRLRVRVECGNDDGWRWFAYDSDGAYLARGGGVRGKESVNDAVNQVNWLFGPGFKIEFAICDKALEDVED